MPKSPSSGGFRPLGSPLEPEGSSRKGVSVATSPLHSNLTCKVERFAETSRVLEEQEGRKVWGGVEVSACGLGQRFQNGH